MPDMDEARRGYRKATETLAASRDGVVAAQEKVKRLERAVAEARRRAADGRAKEDVARLEQQLSGARAAAKEARAALSGNRGLLDGIAATFGKFADPAEAASRLPDSIPIALFPLRIETRYKTVSPAPGVSQQQLWVRVYPDEILVDGFQPEISQAELDNLGIYWTHRWRAGGDPAALRAAWLALARAHGAGRAEWLIGQYAPVNAAGEPAAAPGDHILVIRTLAPVPATELPAITAYWARIWSSGGQDSEAAYADLSLALGAARADEVVATLAPVNLIDPAVKPGPSITPRVHVLQLPDPAGLPISAEDWTRGAHAALLPERLMVMGFRGGAEVFRQLGQPIPPDLRIGPDPSDAPEDQIKADGADIETSEAMDWMVDFEVAVSKGMGFVINLTERGIAPEFDRLFVLGLRLSGDAAETAAEVETLITHHQASRKGLTLVPQGQPTNNTEASKAGYSWWEANDAAYDHFHPASPHADPPDWRQRRDGAWLAGLLGIDAEVLKRSPGYFGTDQAEARAINTALWPATLGYYMEQMMEPVFSEDVVARTRDFFCRHVIGRGTTPILRIGRQPYGILPATVWSRLSFRRKAQGPAIAGFGVTAQPSFLDGLHGLVERAATLWGALANGVSHAGAPGKDPQQTLLDIIGLHPVSAEFYQRYSQSFTQHYNMLGFASDLVSAPVTAEARRYVLAGLNALSELGWSLPPGGELPELLEKIFLKKANLLKGDLVSPALSETAGLPADRADGLNYIEWLQIAARSSHDTLRKQEGFTGSAPTSLLYQMLHHALDLGFVDSGLQLRREALQWTEAIYKAERKEPKFLWLADEGAQASRWTALYAPEAAVTGNASLRLGDFIPSVIEVSNHHLSQQLAALDLLKHSPTARLERVFVEHLDCLSYRLDAWRLGLLSARLSEMREESSNGFARRGLHVGAYGWVENLRPSGSTRQSVALEGDLAPLFDDADAEPLAKDSLNYGHIHAPSLDQAVTAAILRNGHLAHATPSAPDLLAVDLSSERVRLAQQAIEGMRNGQSLGALLGYRLERGLHDQKDLFLDRLIYALRRAFPLAGNRNRLTRLAVLTRIQKVEARNVVDGVAFARHIDETGADTYPYGLSTLPALSDFTGPGLPTADKIGKIIDREVAMMRTIGDAVADLATAEGVYQVVRGNFDKAAGSLDAFSKGIYPPEVEVVSTPRSGHALTQRVGLHLAAGVAPGSGGQTTPRAQGEPSLAQWLAGQLPAPATIFARVRWTKPGGTTDQLTVSMQSLGLTAADLFYMIDAGGARDMAAFDELLIDHAQRSGIPAPADDAVFSIEYRLPGVAGISLFELAPLVRSLRGFVLGARPLRPTDLALQNDAARSDDVIVVARSDKVTAVQTLLSARKAPVVAFAAAIEADTGKNVLPETARDAARDKIDAWIDDYGNLVRPLAPFGLRSAGLTVAIESRRAPYLAMQTALEEIATRWSRFASEYDAVMTDYAALPAAATDDDRRALLLRAASHVSTTVITPLPAAIPALEAQVASLRTAFDSARTALDALRTGNPRCGALLKAITAFLPAYVLHDLTPFDITPFRSSILALAQDLQSRAKQVVDDIADRLDTASKAMTEAAAATGEKAHKALLRAQQAMLGQDFILLPEFQLPATTRGEWDNAWADRLAILEHLTTPADGTPFPIDDWLNGIARVRGRLHNIETAAMLGPALGAAAALELAALQFPYRAQDVWLGLDMPSTYRDGTPFTLEHDRLLYTAHFATGALIDPADPAKSYCGLLIDEWVEVIPGTHETTGLSFHYNRPNSEAPQAVLLVTPPALTGQWQWQDIVDTLHETLDFARLRAVEPDQLAKTELGPLLPAILASVTMLPITAMLNFAINNDLHLALAKADP